MPSHEHGAVQPNASAFRWEVLLSERLRAGAIPRLDTREAPARPLTLEGIQAKLLAAAQRRESMKRTRSGRELAAPVSASDVARHRRQLMEERLASAAANRQQRLAAVVAAAARRHSEVHSRCRALKERQGQLAARLETHLQQAEAARVARLAQTSARAGQAVARVREAAAEARVREGMQAARLKLSLLQRLQRADHSRQEALQAMLAGQARGGGASGGAAAAGGSPYLARHATKRAQLRRQCSSRKVQAAWRAFTAHRQTTRALAAGFAATGVPFTVPLQPDSTPEVALRGHSNTSNRGPAPVVTLRVPAGQSAGASPFGTPDPCSSPTSTVRRPDGRLQSAPVSITHTPHTTPNRTPGPSAAGSPTRPARRVAYTAATASGGAPAGSTATTAAARDSPLPAAALPTTPQAPDMPPLRSIGSPASAPLPASHARLHPGAGGFEQLAAAISAPATLKAARALLQRLESRASLKGVSAGCCAGLLRRLFPRGNPPPRPQPSSAGAGAGAAGISRARAAGQQVPQQRGQAGGERARQAPQQGGQQAPPPPQQERYPARVFLCAYMLLSHPEVVFSSRGEREAALSSTAAAMVAAFEALLGRLLEPAEGSAAEGSAAAGTTTPFGFGSVPSAKGGASAGAGAGALSAAAGAAGQGEASGFLAAPLAALLQRFDEAWVAYLEQFVAWKSADAAGLETELIRVAVELESSRLAKLAGRPAGGPGAAGVAAGRLRSEQDMEAIVAGVDHDLHLIAERVQRLTGAQGAARLAAALAAARAAAAAAFAAQLRQEEEEEGEAGGSMSEGAAGSQSSSPGRSPARKVHRSRGQYSSQSTGGTAVGGATEAGFMLPGPLPSTSLPEGSPSLSPSSSPPPPSSSSSSALTAALRQEAAAAVDMDALLAGAAGANLALMWQLLHDPAWRLPSTDLEAAWLDALGETDPLTEAPPSSEALAAAATAGGEQLRALVGGRVKRIAERAFWDSVQEKLHAAGPTSSSATATASTPQAAAAEQAAGLLAGLGVQLGEVLPPGSSEAQEVAARLDQASLLQALLPGSGSGTLDVPALLSLLDWSAGLLVRLGAPARDAAAAHAQAVVRGQLAAAGGEGSGVAAAAVRALRLLSVQLKLLRLDAGNAQLGMLAAQLTSQGAAAYATAKLEALLGPAQAVSEECLRSRLPHTRAWLAAASGQLPQLELQHLDPPSPVQQQQQQQRQELPALRSGLGRAQAGSQPLLQQQQQQQRLQLLVPVALHSWRGLVRLGLVQLVAGEGAAARLPLPETLRLDSGRLHAAQAEFQRLQVMAACLLLCRQGAAAAGLTFGPPELAAAKRRLAALLADPAMRLADLAAEVACLTDGQGGAAREAAVQDSISRMLGRGGAAMKALTGGFSTALLAHLLLGSASPDAQQQASLALRRCGGGDLEAEVGALAVQLAGLAAVGEGVSGQWHCKMSSDLL